MNIDAGTITTRQARAQHRHDLRTLTYVTLDQANGGIVRNLTSNGMGVQVVAAVRPRQQLRVRFELRYPRLHVETQAEVVWATFSGQCGIRFLEIPHVLQQQINQWIFGNLLEGISLHSERSESIFAPPPGNGSKPLGNAPVQQASTEPKADDGLLVSATPVKVIELPMRRQPPLLAAPPERAADQTPPVSPAISTQVDGLSRPLSGRTLAWTVDVLVVFASVLLFTLVFLSVTREAPSRPLALATTAVLTMAGIYWIFFYVVVGTSLGAKLAQIADADTQSADQDPRFP